MEVIYEVHRWDGLRWHNVLTKIHKYWLVHSGNIKVITSTIWESAVLVLLMGRVWCTPLRWSQMAWHMHTNFHDDRFRNSNTIKGTISTIWEAAVLVLLMKGIYDVRHWDGPRWHDIYTHTRFHENWHRLSSNIMFCLRNMRGCNVGITDGRDSWSAPLKWFHVSWYIYQVPWRSVKAFNSC
jgi:hypothetical protein